MLVDKTLQLECKGKLCMLYIYAEDDKLQIIAEDRHKAKIWQGNFSPRFIEDITTKMGNFKRFHTFVKMLVRGLDTKSDSVRVRLLASSQLQELKGSRRVVKYSRLDVRKYVVVTYNVEFDIVNYVLPLQFQEIPDSLSLMYVLSKYRTELNTAFNIQTMKEDCESGNTQKFSTNEYSREEENEIKKLKDNNKLLEEKLIQLEFQREKVMNELSKLVKSNNTVQIVKDLKSFVNELKGETISSDYTRIKKAKEVLGTTYHSVDNKTKAPFELSMDSPSRYKHDKAKSDHEQSFRNPPSQTSRRIPSPNSIKSSSSSLLRSENSAKTHERLSIGSTSRNKSPSFASNSEGVDITDIQMRLSAIRTMLNLEY